MQEIIYKTTRKEPERLVQNLVRAYSILMEDTQTGVYGRTQFRDTVIEVIGVPGEIQVRLTGRVANYIEMDIRRTLGRAICEKVDEEDSLF